MSSIVAKSKRMLRLGFVPLTDCAPLVLAQELGLFKKYGLNVALSRELGWATIRDKIIHGELDAAHAVAGMPVAATLGLGSIPCECLTGLVLNLNGNAITISQQLWQSNIRDAATLRAEITKQRGRKVFTFGIVAMFSSHHFLLRNWLKSAGIEPNEVRIVVVPPPQMVANLKAGHLDGFCVGEPWNSVAVRSGEGVVLGVSAELDPLHPEKVLMVRREFAQQQEAQHLALIAALLEACAFCDQPVNHDHVSQVLARPEWVNVPAEVLRGGLGGPLQFARNKARVVPDFFAFHRHDANEPSADKAGWVLRNLRSSGLCPEPALLNAALGRRIFRPDIFLAAQQLQSNSKPELELETENEIQTQTATY